jgi:hypothetical protein
VAQGVDEAQRQRELTKQQLAGDAARLESRVRAELDWRARLQREGPRLVALGAGTLLLIGTIALVRRRVRPRHDEPETGPASLDDLAVELKEIRRKLERRGGEPPPLWQRVLLGGVSAAGAAAGTYAAKQVLTRQAESRRGEAETSRAG